MADEWFWIEGINPLPWVASEGAAGRRGGKITVNFYKAAGLAAYQAAVKEEMELCYPNRTIRTGKFGLEFWFWRQLEQTELGERRGHKNQADATNMQKALEDALQGILYTNDRNVVTISSHVVEQTRDTKPRILVCMFDRAIRNELGELLWKKVTTEQPRPTASQVDPDRGFEPPDDNCF